EKYKAEGSRSANQAEPSQIHFFVTPVIRNGGQYRTAECHQQKYNTEGIIHQGGIHKLPSEKGNLMFSVSVSGTGDGYKISGKNGAGDYQVIGAVGPIVHGPAIDNFF